MARATNDLSAVRQIVGTDDHVHAEQTLFVVVIILPLMFRINWSG